MADLLNSLINNTGINSDNPMKKLLNTGIDKERNNFLKGLKTTSSGQKEDPTYLGFRLLFDYGIGARIDEETFLPISPLLCNDFQMNSNNGGRGMDMFTMSKQIRRNISNPSNDNSPVANVTSDIYYYTAEGYLDERRSKEENDLRDGHSMRADSLRAFKTMIRSVNEKSPWFIKSIDGLNTLLTVSQNRPYPGVNVNTRSNRSGLLTFNCMDSIDLRMSAMADFYRKATYDYVNHRDMIPNNLKKFRMWIIVTEIRNINLDRGLLDVLNPFNIPVVGNIASNVADIMQAGGINLKSKAQNGSVNPTREQDEIYSNLSKMEPYIYMYQLDGCEFDFDEYAHIPSNLSNEGSREGVSNKFKIHVGNITEKKLQYNILSDLVQNKSSFSPILIADSWNMVDSIIPSRDFDINNDGNLFGKLANNFINNSVSSVVQQYSPIVSQAVLGNAYGFQINDLKRMTNSVQDAVSGIENMKAPFADYRPQSRGLGGPKERVYPSINLDTYGNVAPSYFLTPGNVYPGGTGYGTLPPTDLYGDSPGKDLGLPDRVYPSNTADLYPDVSGKELGVPDRVYPAPNLDLYGGVPGPDLGLPLRVYPSNTDDVYPDVAGTELGAPDRVYPAPNLDVYPGVNGPDLGLPDRVYPSNTGDEYPDVAGSELGAPDRVYPTPNLDLYPTVNGPDLGLPTRVYPSVNSDEYPDVAGSELGAPDRVYPAPNLDLYPTVNGPDLGLPDRVYPVVNSDEYNDVPGGDLGAPGRVYNAPNLDEYPGVNGPDLGLPDRVYPNIISDEYSNVPGNDLGAPDRIYDQPIEDLYPTVNGPDLGLPSRNYPGINMRVYPSGTPQQNNTIGDSYPNVPGEDLGLPDRDYPGINPNQ